LFGGAAHSAHGKLKASMDRPQAHVMSSLRKKHLQHYAAGLAATFVGAWLTAETGSMLPLALGAAAALMCTFSLVMGIWRARR